MRCAQPRVGGLGQGAHSLTACLPPAALLRISALSLVYLLVLLLLPWLPGPSRHSVPGKAHARSGSSGQLRFPLFTVEP